MSRSFLTKSKRSGALSLALVGALSGAAASAAAQARAELIPFMGSFLPLTDFGDVSQSAGEHSTFRQQIGVLAGARLRLYLSDAIGLEGSAAYVTSGWTEKVENTGGGLPAGFSLGGNITMLGARLTLAPRRTNVYGILGAGYMNRGGVAWDEAQWRPGTAYNKSNFAGIIGGGLRAAAFPKFLVDLTAEVHIDNKARVAKGFALGSQPFHNAGLQSELLVTAGVPIGFGSR